MLKTFQLSLVLVIGLFLIACEAPQKEDSSEEPTVQAQASEPASAPAQEADTNVQLNDGEKWKANPETTEGIRNMQQLLADFEGLGNPEAVQELQLQLKNEFTLIFERCTMTGEAHEQLHNYLIPIKSWINGFKVEENAGNPVYLEQFEAYLNSYFDYFK